MKIISEEVTIHAFSVPGYILPTFQKAKMKSVKGWFKSRHLLRFSYFEKEGDSIELLKETIIEVTYKRT